MAFRGNNQLKGAAKGGVKGAASLLSNLTCDVDTAITGVSILYKERTKVARLYQHLHEVHPLLGNADKKTMSSLQVAKEMPLFRKYDDGYVPSSAPLNSCYCFTQPFH